MITEKDFNEALKEFTERMRYLQDSLESLYQGFALNTNPDVRQAAREIERVQFDSFTNPLSITSDGFIHKMKVLVRNQEAVKDLPKMVEYVSALKSIRHTLDILDDKVVDYRSES